ncbi:carbonic anhydrase 2-like [Ptychodera flava]|uniref:carbonic anhydrase 2-like n=1 Tax=Ptychodera flava TaxID=63121 RepID=UPI00396A16F9
MAFRLYSTALVFLFCVYCVSSRSVKRTYGAVWSYEGDTGPEYWPEIDTTCAGDHQSPIDVVLDDTKDARESFGPFEYTLTDGSFTITNNGHSAQVDIDGGTYEFSGSGLPGEKYRLQQFHWHWGSTNDKGSEHTVDGKQEAAENHFVLYDMDYESYDAAKTEADAIAVISVLITIGEEDNPAYVPIVDALANITNTGVTISLEELQVQDFLPKDMEYYAHYRGSFTTPSCYETVIWTIMQERVEISQKQIDAFRTLLFSDGKPMVDNFRPTQPVNDRVVYLVK